MIIAVALSCSGDKPIETPNIEPVIAIESDFSDINFFENQFESFSANVSDQDHSLNELEVRWSVDQRVNCDWTTPSSDGKSECLVRFNLNESSVIAEVRDPQGASGQDSVQIYVLATEVKVTSTYCASGGTSTDPTGNQIVTCLSEPGVTGQETSDPSGNTFQSGSIFVYSPE